MQKQQRSTARQRSFTCWMAAMALASLVYLCLWLFGAEIRFGTTDDGHIMRAFLGFEAGELPRFHVFLHALLTYPLYWLSTAFPTVPWFSVLQMAFMWLACTVTVKSLLQCFLKYRHSFWSGLFVSVLYIVAFVMEYCCHVTFTVTAASLGAASVAQILSIDYIDYKEATDGSIVRSMALSLLLLALAYALRQITALPILGFCGLAFLMGIRQRRQAGHRALRPFAAVLVLVVLVMGGLVVQRAWDIDRNNAKENLRFQQSTGNILDYVGFADVSQETLDGLGWTSAERTMVEKWYMLDENITADACDIVYEEQLSHMDRSLGGRAELAWKTLTAAFDWEKNFTLTVWLLLAAAGIGLVALLPRRRGQRLWPALELLAVLLLASAMLAYLAANGRLPLRAMLMPILPAAAMVVCLLPGCVAPVSKNGWHKGLRIVAACGCIALVLCYALPVLKTYAPDLPDEEAGESNIYVDMYEFALNEPDMLVIYDLSLFADTRMFPDLSQGIPHNLVCWGTWTARSPGMYKQMAQYGIDGQHFTAADFLRENVCLVSVTFDPPPLELMAYIEQALGITVDYSYYNNWGGIHAFTFYQDGVS